MIPRYQRIVYWCLVGGCLLLAILLLRGCARSHQRIAEMRDQSPIAAPSDVPDEQVQIARAHDADATVTLEPVTLALPSEPSQRVRVLLERMLADDASANSAHPVPAVPAVSDVFLLPLPLTAPGNQGPSAYTTSVGLGGNARGLETPHSAYGTNHSPGAQLVVVNLTKAFADAHASGIETEDLTLRAILATIHANLPQVEEVRFLVDSATRPTLAGHADLSRPYSVDDPAKSIHVLSPDGNPL